MINRLPRRMALMPAETAGHPTPFMEAKVSEPTAFTFATKINPWPLYCIGTARVWDSVPPFAFHRWPDFCDVDQLDHVPDFQ